MLSCNQVISFASGGIEINSIYRKMPTSSEYIGISQGIKYLIKLIPMPTPQLKEMHFQELTNQKLIQSDTHVLRFIDHAILQKESEIGLFKMEFAENGTLKKFMKNHELTEEQISYIFKEILLAVIKINDSGIIHRNINPGNIWIDKNFCFKLSGFERSLRVDDLRQTNLAVNCQRLNHPILRPPDTNENIDIAKYDVWGLGCLLFYLIYRRIPFGEEAKNSNVSPYLLEIVNQCLEVDPDERPLPRVILNTLNSHQIPTLSLLWKNAEDKVITLQYSGLSCMKNALISDTNPPDLFYLQQITFAVWTQPERINDFLQIIANANNSLTLIAIKSLIIMHRLLLSGPKEMLTKLLSINLETILNLWNNKAVNSRDEYYCEYFSGLVRQLSRILLEKINFHNKTNSSGNWKSLPKQNEFTEAIAYLGRVVRICEGLAMGMSILPGINSFLAMQLVEEFHRLIGCYTPLDKYLDLIQFTTRLDKLNSQPVAIKPEAYKSHIVAKTAPVKSKPFNELEIKKNINDESIIYNPCISPRDKLMSKTSNNFKINDPDKSHSNTNAEPETFKDLLNFGNNLAPSSQNLILSDNPMIPPQNNDPSMIQNPIPQPKITQNVEDKNIRSRALINPQFKANPQLKIEKNLGGNQNSYLQLPSPIRVRHNSSDSNPVKKATQNLFAPKPTERFSIEKRWVINPKEVKLGPVLGAGASCTVFKGEYKRTPVAVKSMRESYSGQNLVQEFQREVSAMVSLRHPNLVLFMGASIDPQMMIISEFCAGESLFKLLHEKKNIMLHWRQKLKMIIDIARGMIYLHEASPPIIHRDLKSLNLLLVDQVTSQTDSILVKITDFGISRIVEAVGLVMTVRMGTCHWMAPEVINSEPYSLAADVYSFGIVVWEIVVRDTPYRGMNPAEIPMKVLRGERPDLNAVPAGTPPAIKDLIRSCWDQNPLKRPNFRHIMQFLDNMQGGDEF